MVPERLTARLQDDKPLEQINAKVEDTLNEWFGVEYELAEG